MIERVIKYETVSPAVLTSVIDNSCINALCRYRDIDEDHFLFMVSGWIPMNEREVAEVEKVLSIYGAE